MPPPPCCCCCPAATPGSARRTPHPPTLPTVLPLLLLCSYARINTAYEARSLEAWREVAEGLGALEELEARLRGGHHR